MVNIESVSVRECLYVLSNTLAIFEVQFIEKIKQHWGCVEKKKQTLLIKKRATYLLQFFCNVFYLIYIIFIYY